MPDNRIESAVQDMGLKVEKVRQRFELTDLELSTILINELYALMVLAGGDIENQQSPKDFFVSCSDNSTKPPVNAESHSQQLPTEAFMMQLDNAQQSLDELAKLFDACRLLCDSKTQGPVFLPLQTALYEKSQELTDLLQ